MLALMSLLLSMLLLAFLPLLASLLILYSCYCWVPAFLKSLLLSAASVLSNLALPPSCYMHPQRKYGTGREAHIFLMSSHLVHPLRTRTLTELPTFFYAGLFGILRVWYRKGGKCRMSVQYRIRGTMSGYRNAPVPVLEL